MSLTKTCFRLQNNRLASCVEHMKPLDEGQKYNNNVAVDRLRQLTDYVMECAQTCRWNKYNGTLNSDGYVFFA